MARTCGLKCIAEKVSVPLIECLLVYQCFLPTELSALILALHW